VREAAIAITAIAGTAAEMEETQMKAIAITLLLLGFQTGRLEQQWGEIFKDERISVEIERVLYEKENDPRFFSHVRIRNLASETMEVDLRDRWNVFYPNQMVAIDTERRGVIDELVAFPRPLDEPFKKELIDLFGLGKLTPIPSGASIEYFVDFNSDGGPQAVKNATRKFIVLSIKGQIFTTDGKQAWAAVTKPERSIIELAIPRPVSWKTIPAGAAVVTHQ
jgi:hypothetical protein